MLSAVVLVYKITNVVNQKSYVGQTTKTLGKRWRQHCSAARHGSTAPVHRAIRKYGSDAFKLQVLEVCSSVEQLNCAERYWVGFCQSNVNSLGYNCTTGGEGGYVYSLAARLRISAAQKKRSADPDRRKQLSEMARKQWADPAIRQLKTAKAHAQFSTPEARQASSYRLQERFRLAPEHRTKLARFNQTEEARAAKSVSRKAYFQIRPEARLLCSKAQRQRAKIGEVPVKAHLILDLVKSPGVLSQDIAEVLSKPVKWVTEGLSRYSKLGEVSFRSLLPGERPDVRGRSRCRAKVWFRCE